MTASDDLQKLVARLEKVNEQLDKKQTKPLRDEQNELMVKIQQATQGVRERNPNRGQGELLTHEHLARDEERGDLAAAKPGTVVGGVN